MLLYLEFDILSSMLESDANYRLNNELIEFEKLQLISFDNFLTSHFYYYYDFEYDYVFYPNDVRKTY